MGLPCIAHGRPIVVVVRLAFLAVGVPALGARRVADELMITGFLQRMVRGETPFCYLFAGCFVDNPFRWQFISPAMRLA